MERSGLAMPARLQREKAREVGENRGNGEERKRIQKDLAGWGI